ncbi:hypothetical protein PQX77_021382 [Marasmius sp. AFHP31]|nr:hypothetical protein PQX77_021382 [Marasmius sp. AFHP31]
MSVNNTTFVSINKPSTATQAATAVVGRPSSTTNLVSNSAIPSIRIDTRIFSVEQLQQAMDRYGVEFGEVMCKPDSIHRAPCTDLVSTRMPNSTMMLCESVVDPSAKGIMQSLLSTSFLPNSIPSSAIRPVYDEEGQVVEYKLDAVFATILKLKFQVLGAFVVGMANGLDRLGVEDCPLAIPKDVFSLGEWTSVSGFVDPVSRKFDAFPFIRLAEPSPANSFTSLSFASQAHVHDFLRDAEQSFDVLARWIVDSVQRSIALGASSIVNAGGPFFIPSQEYLQRVGRIPSTHDLFAKPATQGMEMMAHPIHSSLPADPTANLSLIIHPIYSNAVLEGTFEPYDPRKPSFDVGSYVPSAYCTTIPSEYVVNEGLGLKRKRSVRDVGGRDWVKKAKTTGGAM